MEHPALHQERPPMFRKTIIAVAATSLIAAASITPASAHGWGYHGWGYGGWGWGAAAVGAGLLGATIAATVVQPPVNCWQYQLVQTPSGYYKKVMVNVC